MSDDDADITPEDFERLLRWLDLEHTKAGGPYDPERAGARYEKIRRRLIVVWASRGGQDPETWTDVVIKRVTRKVCQPGWDWDDNDPLSYFLAVLNFVFKEYLRILRLEPPPAPPPAEGDDEERFRALDACMWLLPGKERDLLLRYHEGAGRDGIERRERLAEELGISRNALSIRMHRVLRKLAACVRGRLEDQGKS